MHTLRVNVSEHVYEKFVSLLKQFNKSDIQVIKEEKFQAMSIEEFNRRINQSENDFENNRFIDADILLEKYQ